MRVQKAILLPQIIGLYFLRHNDEADVKYKWELIWIMINEYFVLNMNDTGPYVDATGMRDMSYGERNRQNSANLLQRGIPDILEANVFV